MLQYQQLYNYHSHHYFSSFFFKLTRINSKFKFTTSMSSNSRNGGRGGGASHGSGAAQGKSNTSSPSHANATPGQQPKAGK